MFWPTKRKGAEEVFWALVPPSVCFLIWGGERASAPALGKPGVIQEILLSHYLLSLAPFVCGQEIKRPGNKHQGSGLLRPPFPPAPCRIGHWNTAPPHQAFSPCPPHRGPSTSLTSLLPLFLLRLVRASTFTCPLRTAQSCCPFLCAFLSVWPQGWHTVGA